MRIPLDYYRILCVPAKATTAQITQAYRDRLSQFPRREHNALAIEARNRIIEQAFEVLSQTETRAIYDHELSGNMFRSLVPSRPKLPFPDRPSSDAELEALTAHQPTIDIAEKDLLGGLLLLLDLGEYELVLKWAAPYLKGKGKLVKEGKFGAVEIVEQELRLCLALAHWELSREQWLQQHYEQAAISGQKSQELLVDTAQFEDLQQEIQADLHRLRPYQVLELLARPESEARERQRGLQLLQEMLSARVGIDGQGDDQSGLSIDDFLRFIQQLRSYLTVQEQLDLFVAESKRPSAAAAYLAVYALLAAGFSRRQPDLVVQAQTLLERLGKRQDVYLEQSICALLLGQPTEANQLLEQSQEQEAIAYIREQSAGAPDLLPGLCLYGEQWLKTEVFSHFRDLRQRREDGSVSLTAYFADPEVQQYLDDLLTEAVPTLTPPSDTESTAAPVERPPETLQSETVVSPHPSRPAKVDSFEDLVTQTPATVTPAPPSPGVAPVTAALNPDPEASSASSKPVSSKKSIGPWGAIVAIVGSVLLVVGLVRILSGLTTQEPLQVTLNGEPPLTIPSLDPAAPSNNSDNGTTTETTPLINEAIAAEVIQTWFESKARAFGQDRDLAALENILAEPSLSRWRSSAQAVRSAGTYRTYDHSLTIETVSFNSDQPNVATVEAQVQEKADYYRANGERDPGQSYDSDLRVRYSLVRQGDRWLIRSSQTL
ncbi:IMS domain-containing protein [Picosynechococcus sp. PCC 73109]|uniref:IMS domain-containing protein n=1 Tax=Picosynechococcus sp. PCC 73109 TaxID=374982 RepID=UPI00074589A6|nr:IMS domain-containing protein [Picosynechococcus sp. PCC 73109]AMA08170.1 molecular chaperone DnaJ [Picosynechococcus sp. PCC 73109]